jgi:hypothetical protein
MPGDHREEDAAGGAEGIAAVLAARLNEAESSPRSHKHPLLFDKPRWSSVHTANAQRDPALRVGRLAGSLITPYRPPP